MALLALILAIVGTWHYADNAATLFSGMIADATWRIIAGGAFVFFAILILAAIVRYLMRELLRIAGLGSTDRFFGALFGIARGFLISFLAVAIGGMVGMGEEPWWTRAKFSPYLERAVLYAKPWIPAAVSEKIHFR